MATVRCNNGALVFRREQSGSIDVVFAFTEESFEKFKAVYRGEFTVKREKGKGK